MTAIKLNTGETGVIKELSVKDNLQRQRLMDLGFIPDQKIELYIKVFGTYAFKIMGAMYGLRKEVAEQIILK